jgi:GNAT superfamily N-acetyltransferase
MGMAETIFTATTASDYNAFGELVRELVGWYRTRYAHDKWFVEAACSHQSLDAELEALPKSYGRPNGKALLAMSHGQICGCVAYRRLTDDICEMKRLFVPERFQGNGTGRRLCEAIIAAAKDDGFALMRLDTGNLLTEAIGLYRSVGFHPCAAYNDYPSALMSYLVFMEMPLSGG